MAIIDGDGHFVEPVALWEDYVPQGWRDRIHLVRDESGHATHVVVGDFVVKLTRTSDSYQVAWGMGDALTPGGMKEGRPRGLRFEEAEPGGWDPQRRLAVNDAEDIAAAVLFPSLALRLGAVTDGPVAITACRAVNDWAADYASAAPDELYMVASLPQHDPAASAEELRRCVERYGFVAAAVRPNPSVDGRLLGDPSYEPLWRAAEELGVPICVHNVASPDRPQLGSDRAGTFLAHHAMVHSLEALAAFAGLFEAGTFDAHPALRFGFMESSCGWAPFWIDRMEEHHEVVGWTLGRPDGRSPHQVFVDQCFVGCEGEETMVPYVQQRFGEESVVWASDFPHFDTEAPFTEDMRERDDMTDSQRDGALRRAAIALYGLDWSRIEAANAARRAGAVPAR